MFFFYLGYDPEVLICFMVCLRFPNAAPGNTSGGGTGGDQGGAFQDDGDDDLYS